MCQTEHVSEAVHVSSCSRYLSQVFHCQLHNRPAFVAISTPDFGFTVSSDKASNDSKSVGRQY